MCQDRLRVFCKLIIGIQGLPYSPDPSATVFRFVELVHWTRARAIAHGLQVPPCREAELFRSQPSAAGTLPVHAARK